MAWLEMSRDPQSRPEGWRLGECLWSPQRKDNGARWAFWQTMQQVEPGDVVFHLTGKSPRAQFIGFSTADSPCILLEQGPHGPVPLFRVELKDFTPFDKPALLTDVFAARDPELRSYFDANAKRTGGEKERLFYVIQDGRVQCLNGAYLSFLSAPLLDLLFGLQVTATPATTVVVPSNTNTGTAMADAARRVGHQAFSENVKKNYGWRCCVPGCPVDDRRFLVGAHIARWADHPELRGQTSNGLCLCVLHDKAFEVGAFTLDDNCHVRLSERLDPSSWLRKALASAAGQPIGLGQIQPSTEALGHHWQMHGFGHLGVAAANLALAA